jgi:hypothetical protein
MIGTAGRSRADEPGNVGALDPHAAGAKSSAASSGNTREVV